MPGTHAKPVKVLIVEDREDDYRYLAMLLLRTTLADAYVLTWAPTFDEGLRAIASNEFDVGLFDYQLGNGTGLDLLREAQKRGCEMPVILLTGFDSAEIDHEASQAGAADYLCKVDLTTIQLERAIRYARRHASMLAELRRTTSLLDGILTSLPVLASRVDAEGALLESRGHGLQVISANEGELVGTNLLTAYPQVADDVRHAIRGGTANFLWEFRNGERSHYFDSYFRFDEERGSGAIGFSVNVTARVEAELERNRQNQLLRSIMRSLPSIAGRLDSNGKVIEAQGAGLAHCGIHPQALVGKVFVDVFPQSRAYIASALRGEAANFSLTGRSDEKEWYVDFFVSCDAEQGSGVTFFGRDMTDRRRLEQALLSASDAEQQRIGADLHDGLGQQLTGLACLAAALRERLQASNPNDAAQADMIARIANEATEQSRALARGLSPVQLEQHGLSSALEDLTFQSQRLHRIECRFRTRGQLPQPDHLTAIHLYRITQEAIHNAVRHGEARSIHVSLISSRSAHRLVIEDNGRGFVPEQSVDMSSRGLKLMGFRANMIGGTLSISSHPGRGTRVECLFGDLNSK